MRQFRGTPMLKIKIQDIFTPWIGLLHTLHAGHKGGPLRQRKTLAVAREAQILNLILSYQNKFL